MDIIHTNTIVTAKDHIQEVTFIDTAGSDTAMPKDKLNDKRATDALLKEIALHLASFIIIVVNRLRATDQTYIQQVIKNVKNSKRNQDIMIVHNLLDVKSVEDINKIIQKEVKEFFGATSREMTVHAGETSAALKFFVSKDNELELQHFILAQQGSVPAKEWNTHSLNAILAMLQTSKARRNLELITEMITYINVKLPQIFLVGDENKDNNRDGDQPKLQVMLHTEQPFIVLSQRSNMKDLNRDPYPLKLSSGLVYDDAGYFVGTDSMNRGQWQPNYNLYETEDDIRLIVDLAGFKKGELQTKVEEEVITIEARREDFKKNLNNPLIHQEQISIGTFKLLVPLKCRIRENDTKVERDEGFYKVICLKKKAAALLFD